MRNENDTSQTVQFNDIRQEIGQMRESVELTRSDARRTKNDLAQYQVAHESHVLRTRVLWVIVILLAVGAAGFSWYGSPILKQQQGLVGKMSALQTTFDNVNTRVIS